MSLVDRPVRPGSPCQPEPRLVLEGAAVAERMVLIGFSAGTTNQTSEAFNLDNKLKGCITKQECYKQFYCTVVQM